VGRSGFYGSVALLKIEVTLWATLMYYIRGFILIIVNVIILFPVLTGSLLFVAQGNMLLNITIVMPLVSFTLYLLIRINAQQQRDYYKRNGLSYPRVERFLDRIAPPKINKKHQKLIDDVYSLKQSKISVEVKGHAKRTLELRCGFVMPDSHSITIELLQKDMDPDAMKEEAGSSYLCMLPNHKKCYAVLHYKIENRSVRWFVKTFLPYNRKEWFKFCVSEDMLLKDDASLQPIDRIEWYEKLIEKIEKKRS
jgi:hypothetical protein